MKTTRWLTGAIVAIPLFVAPLAATGASAKAMYEDALAREQALRAAAQRGADPTLKQVREVIAAYEAVVRRFPSSGYSDNALYQGAMLAVDAFHRLFDDRDQRTAVRLFKELVARYPHSSLVARATTQLAALQPPKAAPTVVAPPAPPPLSPTTTALTTAPPPPIPAPAGLPPASATAAPARETENKDAAPKTEAKARPVAIKDIRRLTMPEVVRVLIELEGEVPFHEERVENPERMFVDLKGTRATAPLVDAILNYPDDAVRQIRIGRHPQNTTRVAIDLADVSRYSVFTLYNPFRVVIDCERKPGVTARVSAPSPEPPPALVPASLPAPIPADKPVDLVLTEPPAAPDPARTEMPTPLPSVTTARKPVAAPMTAPSGRFSLSRQLGLGVSRIVIDPGHGGHDSGAEGLNGVVESALVLDVALRLEKLLLKEPGMDVVMTRRTDDFIPLEERTAIANREGADLFLSIHANAARSTAARGIETYFLNFALNPEAEVVAARENLTTGRTMNALPDIVRAIALNNKLDESRDFATMVQQSMVQRLRAPKNPVRDLGVKQAPFVVLIGAAMPSVLAEISFVTNRQESTQLKSAAYRQRIAEALFNAVVRYQRSLKNARTIAKREAQEK